MDTHVYEVARPQVSVRMYWPEAALLVLSFASPALAWAIGQSGPMLSRSGSIMVFIAAVAEFVMLNRVNKKHLLNACRAKANQTPWDFSRPVTVVGVISLIAGLVGTLIWGYGDLLARG